MHSACIGVTRPVEQLALHLRTKKNKILYLDKICRSVICRSVIRQILVASWHVRTYTSVFRVVPALESGGVEQGVLEIANALVASGHESHVVSAGGRLVDELIKNGTSHHCWKLHKKHEEDGR